MTPEKRREYYNMLNDLGRCGGDIELSHAKADDILCKILYDLGYAEIVAAYERVDKWYA